MKEKKSVKLVFKDSLDIQNLYLMDKYIKSLINNSDCTCYHFFNSYEKEFETILINYLSKYTSSIKVIKINRKPKFLIYLKNYYKRIFYFACNAFISPSAFHKLLEYLFIPKKLIIYKLYIKGLLYKKKSNLRTISFEEFLLNKFNSLVIFFRSDSIHNSIIKLDKNDITINIVRNLDTPFLKGIPTLRANYLFNIYYPIIKDIHLNAFKDHKCVNFNLVNKNATKKIIHDKKRTSQINILYAMSHTAYTKNEIGLILKLREIIPKRINFKVKLHGSNPEYFLKYLSNYDLVDKNLFFANKPNFTHEFINKQYRLISKYDICIGLSTTFFLTAFNSGVKNHLFISDKRFFPYIGCYSREHHKILFKYINAVEIKNIYHLPKIINNFY